MSLRNFTPLIPQGSPDQRFETLLRPQFEALHAAARRMTLSPVDADDLVQDVCLTAFTHLDELENVEYQRAWLLKVMYHRFIDGRRKNRRSPVDMADTGIDSKEPEFLPGPTDQPEELADQDMRIDRVLKAMTYLNPDQCALVGLHDVEGLTIDELQELTGKPAGTIKAQLHRTRAKLGRLMSNDALLRPHLKLVGGKQ